MVLRARFWLKLSESLALSGTVVLLLAVDEHVDDTDDTDDTDDDDGVIKFKFEW